MCSSGWARCWFRRHSRHAGLRWRTCPTTVELMRTAPRTALPLLGLRALLALLLAGGFGFRVVASPAAWGCVMAGQAAHGSDHTSGHQQGHRHHGPDLPACECIAHAPATGVTAGPLELAQPALRPSPAQVAHSADGIPPATASAHLLPFSIGPPPLSTV